VALGSMGRRRSLMARKTSFYYSFLVLPADQRRAIIAVWDFCRAVDDAVDEAELNPPADVRPPREALEYWRAELRLTWLGGSRILDRVEHGRFRLVDRRPTLRLADVPLLTWRALAWRPVGT